MQMLTTPETFRSFWPVGTTIMAGLFSTTKKTMFLCATCLYHFFSQWALRQIDLDQAPEPSIHRVHANIIASFRYFTQQQLFEMVLMTR
jgi:phosphomevalonate kinase